MAGSVDSNQMEQDMATLFVIKTARNKKGQTPTDFKQLGNLGYFYPPISHLIGYQDFSFGYQIFVNGCKK